MTIHIFNGDIVIRTTHFISAFLFLTISQCLSKKYFYTLEDLK